MSAVPRKPVGGDAIFRLPVGPVVAGNGCSRLTGQSCERLTSVGVTRGAMDTLAHPTRIRGAAIRSDALPLRSPDQAGGWGGSAQESRPKAAGALSVKKASGSDGTATRRGSRAQLRALRGCWLRALKAECFEARLACPKHSVAVARQPRSRVVAAALTQRPAPRRVHAAIDIQRPKAALLNLSHGG
jgi:hypothetical protein